MAVTYKIPITKNRMIGRKENDQGRPKGKMIEGRSGGPWRGTRRELWAPPDSGSAHAPRRPLYCVPIPTRAARPGRHAFPSVRRRFVIVCVQKVASSNLSDALTS